MLPGMSGYEVCKELKENEQTANIPIIMVTALMDMENRIHGLKLGADYFLSKPLPYNELKVVLERLINKKIQIEDGEKCFDVMEALAKLTRAWLMPSKNTSQQNMSPYGKKIVHLLHLGKKVEEQVTIATMFYNTGIFTHKDKTTVFFESVKGLKLSGWLCPLVKETTNFVDYSSIDAVKDTKDAVNIMVVLIDYFTSFEKIKSEGEVLGVLRSKRIYDEKVLEALNRVVNDKKMLDFLHAAQ